MVKLKKQIEVVARYEKDGTVTPLRFTWQELEYHILTVGRRWHTQEGEHILVEALPGEQVYELLFSGETWYLFRRHSGNAVI
jgi:hypothetical protein